MRGEERADGGDSGLVRTGGGQGFTGISFLAVGTAIRTGGSLHTGRQPSGGSDFSLPQVKRHAFSSNDTELKEKRLDKGACQGSSVAAVVAVLGRRCARMRNALAPSRQSLDACSRCARWNTIDTAVAFAGMMFVMHRRASASLHDQTVVPLQYSDQLSHVSKRPHYFLKELEYNQASAALH